MLFSDERDGEPKHDESRDARDDEHEQWDAGKHSRIDTI